ncbi:MAG: hypothetical protein PVG71_04430 [Anaerolineae bacterium]|jgi:kojibiose phosphorylase
MARKNDTYQGLIQQLTPDDLLPGVLHLLQELRQAGIRIGVGSASRNTRAVFGRLEPGDTIDAVSDGYRVDRQISVDPDEAIVVEDAASGVEAALAGGFWTVGLGPEERVGAAHFVFLSLEGVALEDILTALGDHVAVQP